ITVRKLVTAPKPTVFGIRVRIPNRRGLTTGKLWSTDTPALKTPVVIQQRSPPTFAMSRTLSQTARIPAHAGQETPQQAAARLRTQGSTGRQPRSGGGTPYLPR